MKQKLNFFSVNRHPSTIADSIIEDHSLDHTFEVWLCEVQGTEIYDVVDLFLLVVLTAAEFSYPTTREYNV